MPHHSQLPYEKIICIPDLLLTQRSGFDGFFDLVREPIRQGCRIDIGWAPEGARASSMLPGFNLAKFRKLANCDNEGDLSAIRTATYYRMPEPAVDYLFSHLSLEGLILSFEMPPWLKRACIARDVDYLDARYSPLQFGRDLYIALDASQKVLRQRIASEAVSDEELRLEAALLGANLRAHRKRLQESNRCRFDLSGSLVYVPQHISDDALLTEEGNFQRSEDFFVSVR